MFRRTLPVVDPITVYLDGAAIPAERGEPLAFALVAADKLGLARSPKLHRPRGPSCVRGGCDGCLARVDGVPNVMTCLKPAQGGERIETQNVVGSRNADLLRVTDWFFPNGIDHHHLMVGVPGLSEIMQSFARKLAGLGHLPSAAEPEHAAKRVHVDVAIVGGGAAGLFVAARLLDARKSVAIVDDGVELGGSSRGLAGGPPKAETQGATIFSRATAVGIHLGDILVVEESGAVVLNAAATVFATGAHDPVIATANNDLPGVFSARALCRLASRGIEPRGTVAIVGAGVWADELARRVGERALKVSTEELESIHGTGQVRAISLRRSGKLEKRKVDAVAFASPPAPAFELAQQAGAKVHRMPGQGFAIEVDADGRASDSLFAIGECTGKQLSLDVFARDAERLTNALVAST